MRTRLGRTARDRGQARGDRVPAASSLGGNDPNHHGGDDAVLVGRIARVLIHRQREIYDQNRNACRTARLKVTRDDATTRLSRVAAGVGLFRRPRPLPDGSRWCAGHQIVLGGPRWEALAGGYQQASQHRQARSGREDHRHPARKRPACYPQCRIKIKPKRIMSEAQKAVLDKARSVLPNPPQKQPHAVKSSADLGVVVRDGEASR